MRAVVVDAPGGPERLALHHVPVPRLDPGEILIEVRYAGCNWGDVQKRQGTYPDPVRYPVVLGAEVSGRIADAARARGRWREGQRVCAITGPAMVGGYAEFTAVPAAYVIAVPDEIDLATAAAFPVVALTAYHLLHTAHRVRKGETILVHAAGGGVGLILTQMATAAGARVIGTVGSPAKRNTALAHGAECVVERTRQDFVAVAMELTGGWGVDIVIDSLGGDVLARSFDALRPFGRVINIGEAAGEPAFAVRKKLYECSTSLAGFEVLHARPGSPRWRRGVRAVVEAIAAGRLHVPIAGTYPLDAVEAAHRALEGRQVAGKLVLDVTATP